MGKRVKEYDRGYLAALADVEREIREQFPVTPVTNALFNYGGGIDDALALISGRAKFHEAALHGGTAVLTADQVSALGRGNAK